MFQKLAPHETCFLLNTIHVETQQINTNDNIVFGIVDFPGNYASDLQRHIAQCGALIYVIDAQKQEDYQDAC